VESKSRDLLRQKKENLPWTKPACSPRKGAAVGLYSCEMETYQQLFWCGYDNLPVGKCSHRGSKGFGELSDHLLDPSRDRIVVKGLSEPATIKDEKGYCLANPMQVRASGKTETRLADW